MTSSKSSQQYEVLGARVDALTQAAAVEQIVKQAADPRKPAVYVIKQYVELMDSAYSNAHNRDLLNTSWLSVPEGVSTQWATAYLYNGQPSLRRAVGLGLSVIFRPKAVSGLIPEKFGGTVFTWKLLHAASEHKLGVYLVGSPKGSDISQTITTLHQRLPNLKIVGSWPGQLEGLSGAKLLEVLPKRPVENELVTNLKATKPDIILVGMGFPLQEELIAKLTSQLPHGVLIGEGGTFDYDSFGGGLRKAPAALQTMGLEWLWRLTQEPERWRRQLAIPRFVWHVYRASKRA